MVVIRKSQTPGWSSVYFELEFQVGVRFVQIRFADVAIKRAVCHFASIDCKVGLTGCVTSAYQSPGDFITDTPFSDVRDADHERNTLSVNFAIYGFQDCFLGISCKIYLRKIYKYILKPATK